MRPPQIAEGEAREALERWVRRTVWRRRGLATSLEIAIDPFSPATDTTIAQPEVRFEAPATPRP